MSQPLSQEQLDGLQVAAAQAASDPGFDGVRAYYELLKQDAQNNQDDELVKYATIAEHAALGTSAIALALEHSDCG